MTLHATGPLGSLTCITEHSFQLFDAFVAQEHAPFFRESPEHADGSSSTSMASDERFDSVFGVAGSAAAF